MTGAVVSSQRADGSWNLYRYHPEGWALVGTISNKADADRIVACLEACAGLHDPVLAMTTAREALEKAHTHCRRLNSILNGAPK